MKSAPDALKAIAESLERFVVGDQDTLAQIGGALEEAAGEIPENRTEVLELLFLCLETLQGIYQETLANPNEAVAATRGAVGAAERCLRSGRYASTDPVHAAGQTLWQALGRESATSPWRTLAPPLSTAEPPPPPQDTVPAEEPAPVQEATPTAVESPAASAPVAVDGIILEFLTESYENLDQLDLDLLALEQDPGDRETISRIFRTIHTIKGTCGFLGFSRLEALAHAGENLLSRLRDGALALTPPITDALLATVDAVRQMLSPISEGRGEGNGDYSLLVVQLQRLQESAPETPVEGAAAESAPAPIPPSNYGPLPGKIGGALLQAGIIQEEDLVRALHEQETGDQRKLGEILAALGVVSADAVERVLHATGAAPTTSRTQGAAAGDSSIRVDVGLLDSLMNLVGELVLARNQILQLLQSASLPPDGGLIAAAQRLNLVTTELQEGVMKTRMQPIGSLWSKFPRVVRDLAHTCGKQVRLEMEGKETDLDKTLLEAIKDPLTHLVRNSVDHGIESPQDRIAAGKSAEGVLLLRAYHEGGQVLVEITDDGAGINTQRVKAKALERGLISQEQAARMTERELCQLIFLPGFSTAAKVTNVSGRGVGMDVVKTNIEKISGTIDIQSRPGAGTTLRIRIPLTLAIVPALIVASDGDRYAIPQVSLLELVRLEPEKAERQIEYIHGVPIYRLRGKLLPLIHLGQELHVRAAFDAGEGPVNIVVLQADDRQFGLVVDEVIDTEEIVVKPLGKHLKQVSAFAGATIMGDGGVALILDVMALAQRAQIVAETRERPARETVALEVARGGACQTLLLFQTRDGDRMAIPLSRVARLEEFPWSRIERIGGKEVVQYRGQIMPLVHLSPSPPPSSGPLPVIVSGDAERSFGIVVDSILDIVEESLSLPESGRRGYLLGTAVLQGRVTEVLDVHALQKATDEDNYGTNATLLHFPSGELPLRRGTRPGPGSDPTAADDAGATGVTDGGWADQSAGANRDRDQSAAATRLRRAS